MLTLVKHHFILLDLPLHQALFLNQGSRCISVKLLVRDIVGQPGDQLLELAWFGVFAASTALCG